MTQFRSCKLFSQESEYVKAPALLFLALASYDKAGSAALLEVLECISFPCTRIVHHLAGCECWVPDRYYSLACGSMTRTARRLLSCVLLETPCIVKTH